MTPEEQAEAKKPWYNRSGGGHPRGGGQSQRDTDLPGHWAYGRAGTAPRWVLEDQRPMKNAPYFATAPLGPDDRPQGYMPNGWNTGKGPVDPTTGSRIGWGHLPTDPALYEPADVPVPPTRPGSQLESRTFGNYLKYTRPMAAAGEMVDATPAQNVPDITPNVDSSAVDALKQKAAETHAALDGLNMNIAPTASMAALDAIINKAREAREALSSIGSAGGATLAFSPMRAFGHRNADRLSV